MAERRETAIIGRMSKRKTPTNPVLRSLTAHRPMEHETSLFLLVSFLDFLMTYWVLFPRESGPRFGESNAIANWFLEGWGMRGLLAFKVALCVFVVLATQAIFHRRPRTAKAVLWLGVVVTSVTVIYSGALYLRHTAAGA